MEIYTVGRHSQALPNFDLLHEPKSSKEMHPNTMLEAYGQASKWYVVVIVEKKKKKKEEKKEEEKKKRRKKKKEKKQIKEKKQKTRKKKRKQNNKKQKTNNKRETDAVFLTQFVVCPKCVILKSSTSDQPGLSSV